MAYKTTKSWIIKLVVDSNDVICIILNNVCLYSSEYGVDYFRQFNVVMNALDNRGEAILVSVIFFVSTQKPV